MLDLAVVVAVVVVGISWEEKQQLSNVAFHPVSLKVHVMLVLPGFPAVAVVIAAAETY